MKKNSKRGFTLIELLGTIVVIAIVALIATPIIMSVIRNSRRTAYLRSAESMGRASSVFYSDNSDFVSQQYRLLNFSCEDGKCVSEDNNTLNASSDIGDGSLAIYTNGDIEYLLSDGEFCVTKYADESSASVRDGNCDKIDIKKDKTPAILDEITYSSTTKSITATITAHDEETGIYGYSCSIDGEHYSEITKNNTCYFPDLKTGTYTVYFKVYNGTYGKDTYSEATSVATFTQQVSTKTINVPEYSLVPTKNYWSQAKRVSITAPNEPGLTALYSLDNGNTWVEGLNLVVSTNNTNVIAKYTDGINTVTASTLLVNRIDNTPPTLSLKTEATTKSISITAIAEDKESGIAGYKYGISSDNGANWEYTDIISQNTYKYDNLKTNTYSVRVYVYNNALINTEESLKNEGNGSKSEQVNIILPKCPLATISIDPANSVWTQQKIAHISYNNNNGCTGSYSVDGGNTWKSGTDVTFTANGNILAMNSDGINSVISASYSVANIDRTVPTSSTHSYTKTTNSITVTASGTDAQSGITRYAFSKDNGATWTGWQTSNTYAFTGLKTGTYSIKTKVYNGTYGTSGATEATGATVSGTTNVTLDGCVAPTFSFPNGDSNTWKQSKLVKISGSSGFTTYYSIDGGNNFVQGDSVNVTSNNASVIARVSDGVNVCTSNSALTVTKIDTSAPTASISSTSSTQTTIRVVGSGTDNESGITGYSFMIDNGSWSAWQTSNVYTFTGLTASTTHTVYVKVKNGTYGSTGATEASSVSAPASKSVSTLTACSAPTFTVSPSGTAWKTSRTVTINYGNASGCTGTYSKNNGSWTSGTSVSFTANGSVTARNVDSDGQVYSATQSVTRIDNSTPSISMNMTSNGSYVYSGSTVSYNVSISVSCSNSGGSSISSYYISASDYSYGTNLGSTSSSSLSINPASASSGTISISASCTTGAGRSNSTSATLYYKAPAPACNVGSTCGYCSSGQYGSKTYNSSCTCVDNCYTPSYPTCSVGSYCGSCPSGYTGSYVYDSSCNCVNNCSYSSTPTYSCTVGASCGSCPSGYTGSKTYNSSCSCVDNCTYSGGSSSGGSSGGSECSSGQTKNVETLGCSEDCKTCYNPYTCENGYWSLGWKYCAAYWKKCTGTKKVCKDVTVTNQNCVNGCPKAVGSNSSALAQCLATCYTTKQECTNESYTYNC